MKHVLQGIVYIWGTKQRVLVTMDIEKLYTEIDYDRIIYIYV